jgi:hypothetical protein
MLKLKKMEMKRSHFNYIKLLFITFSIAVLQNGCKKGTLDKQPLDVLSDETFWKTESDANLALVGCYHTGTGFDGEDFWMPRSLLYLDLMAGNGSEKELIPDRMTDGSLNPSYWVPGAYWQHAYEKITSCNNFLAHIGDISMDATKKAIMVAEVRTLRAYEYLNLALYFGDVPLNQKVLTIAEANSVSRTIFCRLCDPVQKTAGSPRVRHWPSLDVCSCWRKSGAMLPQLTKSL